MAHEVLKDFIKFSDVNSDIIQRYEGILPDEMISLWKEKGFGTFYNGYLKTINPDDYKQLIEKSYFQWDVSIPIFATAFGDILTWEKNKYVGIVKYRYGNNDVISSGFEFFFDIISDEECAYDYFTVDDYNKAIKIHGTLEYDECFGYFPLLAMGGKKSIDNIKKVKIREHIALITSMIAEI